MHPNPKYRHASAENFIGSSSGRWDNPVKFDGIVNYKPAVRSPRPESIRLATAEVHAPEQPVSLPEPILRDDSADIPESTEIPVNGMPDFPAAY